jgi:glucoamylase
LIPQAHRPVTPGIRWLMSQSLSCGGNSSRFRHRWNCETTNPRFWLPDLPAANLRCGGPTGSAAPLVWAHSEYLRLVRSRHDGIVFDLIAEAAQRYGKNPPQSRIEFWLPKHPLSQIRRQCSLRICGPEAFRLRWTNDDWATWHDNDSRASGVEAEFLDLGESQVAHGVQFTFFSKASSRWEGRNYRVETT